MLKHSSENWNLTCPLGEGYLGAVHKRRPPFGGGGGGSGRLDGNVKKVKTTNGTGMDEGGEGGQK